MSLSLDKIGITASVLCAVHCAFLPVVIGILPLFSIGFLANDWVESLMILSSVLIAATSLGTSYKRHRRILPLVLLFAGMSVIAVVHLFLPENLEPFILPLGGLTVATAHYLNWNYCGKCTIDHSHSKHVYQITKL